MYVLPKAESFLRSGASARWGGNFAAGFGAPLCCGSRNNGELRPFAIHWRATALQSQREFFRRKPRFLTLEMLGNVPRPEMNCADGGHSAASFIGRRETSQWFFGTPGQSQCSIITWLGVWVGNFDGHANPAFVGRTAAAPLLFQIIDSPARGVAGTNCAASTPAGSKFENA